MKIKITENKLMSLVNEAVNRILSEAGNLYGTDSEGNTFTNSEKTWRGVPGTTFIWHGEWSDPEVIYKGQSFNETDLEDYLWAEYKELCDCDGKKALNDADFDKFCDVPTCIEALESSLPYDE